MASLTILTKSPAKPQAHSLHAFCTFSSPKPVRIRVKFSLLLGPALVRMIHRPLYASPCDTDYPLLARRLKIIIIQFNASFCYFFFTNNCRGKAN
jgi:hypothetical protein